MVPFHMQEIKSLGEAGSSVYFILAERRAGALLFCPCSICRQGLEGADAYWMRTELWWNS